MTLHAEQDIVELVYSLRQQNANMRKALETVEWNPHTLYCPWCGMGEEDGHADDCQRQQALELGKYKP